MAGVAGEPPVIPASPDGEWGLGDLVLGPREVAADILTLTHTSDEVRRLVAGPPDAVASFAERVRRRPAPHRIDLTLRDPNLRSPR